MVASWVLTSSCLCPAIEKDGGDIKALYRRSQALEKLGRLDQAMLDLQRCVSLEPKNRAFQEALRNIAGQIQEKVLEGCGRCRVGAVFSGEGRPTTVGTQEASCTSNQGWASDRHDMLLLTASLPRGIQVCQGDGGFGGEVGVGLTCLLQRIY